MYKQRLVTEKLNLLASHFPAIVVSGARQVGKSTLVQQLFGREGDYVLLDPLQDIENARREPELFLQNHNQKKPLILDEIQYAPELVPAIKRSIDQNRIPGRFILTGSQQWSVMKSISESLAGRTVFIDLGGFCLQEIAGQTGQPWIAAWLEDPESFLQQEKTRLSLPCSVYETIWRGTLPEATLIPQDLIQAYLEGYFRSYIDRDARQFADVSDWQLFHRFITLVSALTSQEINFSQLGRELGLLPQTARRWLDILKATFQWHEIPAFSQNTLKRISSKPKGYFQDTGLACYNLGISSPRTLAGHPAWGALFETAVVNDIIHQCEVLNLKPAMYHWRTYRGAEVDLILERDGILYPIEIKAAARPNHHDLSGLNAFRQTYTHLKIAPGLIISPAETSHALSRQDWVMPWDVALESAVSQ